MPRRSSPSTPAVVPDRRSAQERHLAAALRAEGLPDAGDLLEWCLHLPPGTLTTGDEEEEALACHVVDPDRLDLVVQVLARYAAATPEPEARLLAESWADRLLAARPAALHATTVPALAHLVPDALLDLLRPTLHRGGPARVVSGLAPQRPRASGPGSALSPLSRGAQAALRALVVGEVQRLAAARPALLHEVHVGDVLPADLADPDLVHWLSIAQQALEALPARRQVPALAARPGTIRCWPTSPSAGPLCWLVGGLGLALGARGLAEAHGASWLRMALGVATDLAVTLPPGQRVEPTIGDGLRRLFAPLGSALGADPAPWRASLGDALAAMPLPARDVVGQYLAEALQQHPEPAMAQVGLELAPRTTAGARLVASHLRPELPDATWQSLWRLVAQREVEVAIEAVQDVLDFGRLTPDDVVALYSRAVSRRQALVADMMTQPAAVRGSRQSVEYRRWMDARQRGGRRGGFGLR